MAQNAGSLGIQITADDAELRAVMKRAAESTTTAFDAMSRSASSFKSVLATFGVGLGAAFFVKLVKDSIDAQARMKDLAQEAGTTASAISRFDAPARMAGVGLDAVAGAMFKMSQAALEAKDPASKAAQALASIGITTAQLKGQRPDQMFELVARSLGNYGDGLEKNAVMQELFGRSGREMNKVVAEIADQAKLTATVTDEQAEAADRLGDQLVALNMESEKLWRGISSEMVPAMNSVLKSFSEGTKEAGIFAGALAGLSTAYKLAGDEASRFFGDPVKNKIIALEDQIAKLEKVRDQGPGLLERITGIDKTPAIVARIRQLQTELTGLYSFVGGTPGVKPALAVPDKPKPDFDPKRTADHAAAMKSLGDANAHVSAEIAHRIAMQKIANREFDDEFEKSERQRLAYEGSIGSVRKYAEQIQFETSIMGLSNDERERAIALRSIETAGISKQDDAYGKLAATLLQSITAQQAARAKQDQEIRAQMEVLQLQSDIVGAFTDGLTDFISGTRSAKDAFTGFIKNVEQQLARLAAQDIAKAIFGASSSSGSTDFFSRLAGAFGGWFGGSAGIGYGTAGSVIPAGGPWAKGGVFGPGGVQAYAMGDVFGSATMFRHAGGLGVMGEAGPEAVMPLARDRSGRLGVRGGGTTVNQVTFNISTPDVNSFRQSEQQIAASMHRALSRSARSR